MRPHDHAVPSRDDTRNLAEIHARQQPLRPVRLSHIVLRTRLLPPVRAWYLSLLNAEVCYENEQVCFMSYDDEHHRLGIIQLPNLGPAENAASGLEHVSFTYDTLGALLANYQRLKAIDIEPYWPINHGPTISMYYKDPDGNRVELQYDVFEGAKGAKDFIDQFYPENFVGVVFDPQEMIRNYEAGMSLEELTRRPPLAAGMSPWDMLRN